MNTDLLEQKGGEPLKQHLQNSVAPWPLLDVAWDEATFDLSTLAIKMWGTGNSALFSFYAHFDNKNSTRRILYFDQPWLGMGGQKYYRVPRNNTMLMAYQDLIHEIAVLMGADATSSTLAQVEAIVDFEKELAEISVPSEKRRDADALYNNMTLRDMQETYGQQIDFLRFVQTLVAMDGVEINDVTEQEVVVNQSPSYFQNLTVLLEKTPKRTVANYMIWRVVLSLMTKQSQEYRDAYQKYAKVVFGKKHPSPRYRVCTFRTMGYFGMGVGQLFIKDNFKAEAKVQALDMIANLQTAFDELLDEVDWMDDVTRNVAKEKNKAIESKIGYPEDLHNNTYLQIYYENYTVTIDDYFQNILRFKQEGYKDNLRRLRQPVDKNKWHSLPSTVNAFYNRYYNRIVFPAGILQPPFFDATYPKSLNYGGIGMIIGHEITHGFDDRGRQYDKEGNLVQWWSESAIESFKGKAQCLVDQYSNFLVDQVDMNVNGINTQGENIADNGGLKESFLAYRKWVSAQGREELPLPGLNYTHNQLFFINFAQLWCSMTTDEEAIRRVRNGAHSLGRYRVIGTVQNSPDFSEAFQCPPGAPMNPTNKCQVW